MARTFKISKVENAVRKCVNLLREFAPKDTGNLAYNAVKMERIDKYTFKIYVDEAIAPYMKYTNENWNNFKPPLYGKKNPNEGWFDRVSEAVATLIMSELGGNMK